MVFNKFTSRDRENFVTDSELLTQWNFTQVENSISVFFRETLKSQLKLHTTHTQMLTWRGVGRSRHCHSRDLWFHQRSLPIYKLEPRSFDMSKKFTTLWDRRWRPRDISVRKEGVSFQILFSSTTINKGFFHGELTTETRKPSTNYYDSRNFRPFYRSNWREY